MTLMVSRTSFAVFYMRTITFNSWHSGTALLRDKFYFHFSLAYVSLGLDAYGAQKKTKKQIKLQSQGRLSITMF